MKITNYHFIDVTGNIILTDPPEGEFCVVGKIYGKEGLEDGSRSITSPVVKIKDGVATTFSGSKYELETMHPDYVELLSAIKSGVPVIKDWALYAHSSYYNGYKIVGHFLSNNEQFLEKITSQEGNYITIADTKCLVIWRHFIIRLEDLTHVSAFGEYHQIPISNFEEYMGYEYCRPTFF